MDHPTRRLDQPPAAAPDEATQRLDDPAWAPGAEDRQTDPAWAPTHCPKCRGARVWAAAIPTGTYNGHVVLERTAAPDLQRGRRARRRTSCAALVCTECGFTEFYAHRPKDLLF